MVWRPGSHGASERISTGLWYDAGTVPACPKGACCVSVSDRRASSLCSCCSTLETVQQPSGDVSARLHGCRLSTSATRCCACLVLCKNGTFVTIKICGPISPSRSHTLWPLVRSRRRYLHPLAHDAHAGSTARIIGCLRLYFKSLCPTAASGAQTDRRGHAGKCSGPIELWHRLKGSRAP